MAPSCRLDLTWMIKSIVFLNSTRKLFGTYKDAVCGPLMMHIIIQIVCGKKMGLSVNGHFIFQSQSPEHPLKFWQAIFYIVLYFPFGAG